MLLLFLILTAQASWAEKELTFSTAREFSAHISEIYIREAYKRLGYNITVRNLPPARALELSNSGRVDGEVFRVADIVKKAPNLVIVPVPLNHLRAMVFTTGLQFEIDGWESLRPYKIGIVRGHRYSESGTEGMNRVAASSLKQLFQMLELGRVDVVVSTEFSGLDVLLRNDFDSITMLDPAVTQMPVYHFLHKKHAGLVLQVAESINQMHLENLPVIDVQKELIKFQHSSQ